MTLEVTPSGCEGVGAAERGRRACCTTVDAKGGHVKFKVPRGWATSRRWRASVHPGRRSVALSVAVAAILTSLAAVPPAAATGAADGATTTGAPATALGEPTASQLSAQDRAVMMEQAPYMELDEQVRRSAAAQASAPLAGSRIDLANKMLHVHWVGAIPAELTSIQKSATQRGITMNIVPAPFSEHTLMAAANDLSKVAEATQADLSVTVHHDGTGLTVRQDGLPDAAHGRAKPTQVQSQILDAVTAIHTKSNIPITLADRGPRPAWADRNNDSSPYWGGAVTVARSHACTSAFSMYLTHAPSSRFMMTAAHCTGYLDAIQVTNGVGERMGVSDFIHEMFDVEPRYDIGVIRLDPSWSNEGKVYSNETISNPFTVVGAASGIPAGGIYCISATRWVPNCNMRSGDQLVECVPGTPFGRCVWIVFWRSVSAEAIAYCNGDSGGPIYYWTSTGIIAAGVVSVGYGGPCYTSGGIAVAANLLRRIPGLAVRHG